MHDLIGAGVAEARRRKRWTQEDLARSLRYHGLESWRTGSVGQLEAGLRRPRLDEVVLICASLGVGLDELLPDADEPVEIGDGAVLTSRDIRAILGGHEMPGSGGEASFPGDRKTAEDAGRFRHELGKMEDLLRPIADRHPQELQKAREAGLGWDNASRPFADAERHAARRLGANLGQVRLAAWALWQRDFTEERDARIGSKEMAALEPRSLQARRGIVTRSMLAELRAELDAAYRAPSRPEVVAAVVTSRRGVLVGRRNDRTPPWTLIAGEREPGERPEDTATREVKEETGLEVRIGDEIGPRVHPKTGRTMIYLAAKPVRGTRIFVGDEAELAEVRWASLAEAQELLPDMYEPVHEYLARTLAATAAAPGGRPDDG